VRPEGLCLTIRRSGFDLRAVYVGFVVDRVALKNTSVHVLRFFPVRVHAHIYWSIFDDT
jgi:hypothetical protein